MATRTAILDIVISLNQWLEEIAKKEAPVSQSSCRRFGRRLGLYQDVDFAKLDIAI
jgi:hypothetical protein